MDIDFKLLRGFVELAREGSFTRAAARLGMSQPALTVQIRKLEAELGFTLFSRSTRALALTPEGQEFVALAERVIEEHAAALAGARRIRAGGHETLRIGAASYTAEITER
ncbi:MAG: LysR family transcriptional regulator, partial [Hyphomonadaceae bacterium]